MKRILVLIICFGSFMTLCAQPAKGKKISENAGRKVLGLFPAQMNGQGTNSDKDKVFGPQRNIGVTVHRDYTKGSKKMTLTLINESPSLATVNKLIAQAGSSTNGKYQVVDVNGYKALIQSANSESNSLYLELLLPIKSSLLVLKGNDVTKDKLTNEARKINIAKIAENL
ncbi:hypothetical protein [Flavisolibacter tropicus]|uniref:DUF4252 domain-containing protein n=1 Tax=Flavisolibacter tropicus TaxID=1492898 RepID=A0A172TQH8_9BACT|nr:hypothetical protein [Flavisolibacter tropicus]ANE49268.1 hypothetical protein SY85_00870 [Flavisolibacter tropicus]